MYIFRPKPRLRLTFSFAVYFEIRLFTFISITMSKFRCVPNEFGSVSGSEFDTECESAAG